MEMQVRKSTVGTRNAQRTYSYVQVPQLRLEGKWLADAGFDSGTKVTVEVKRGKLILKPKN